MQSRAPTHHCPVQTMKKELKRLFARQVRACGAGSKPPHATLPPPAPPPVCEDPPWWNAQVLFDATRSSNTEAIKVAAWSAPWFRVFAGGVASSP